MVDVEGFPSINVGPAPLPLMIGVCDLLDPSKRLEACISLPRFSSAKDIATAYVASGVLPPNYDAQQIESRIFEYRDVLGRKTSKMQEIKT